jgi:hypothetical protein
MSHNLGCSGDAALVSSYCNAQGTRVADKKRASPAAAVAHGRIDSRLRNSTEYF